ncbi:MAG: 3-deoxy-D-manno-octulosonic acid transferase, partial [Acidobacteria bacterium]|nr:3-deoxy-D-manno-octulosonic acid transferase [Acidobacteriota bacterium]MCA1641164.1 3-deoxy-D-manno-octulosonic acid transferase [Acidobacteriota bacterium]
MLLLYSLLLTLGIIALLPAFLWDALRHGKYVEGLRERAGGVGKIDPGGRPVVWLHCVSVGETQAARPLARALAGRFPSHALVVSTTTLTGQRVAREAFRGLAASVFYFPFDWAWSVRRALDAVNPSVVILMETELWFRFLAECGARGVRVALVNGRLSERSFSRYKLLRGFVRRALGTLSLAVMQTEADAARLRELGVAPERVRVSGNVKFDADDAETPQPLTAQLRARFALDASRPLVVAASTHAPEESLIVEAFKRLRAALPHTNPRLLVAPRHPERFAEVAALLDSSGLSWSRRTAEASPRDATCDAILLDTVGELRAAYPLAEVVFVGGSVAPTGGHNVLEPAAAARCAVTGAHTFNFAEIVRDFVAHDALVQLPALPDAETPAALARVFKDLLNDDERRRRLGDNALALVKRNRGATGRTVDFLSPIIERGSG